MIVMDGREETIANIRSAIAHGTLNVKVEPGDPVLTREQRAALRERYNAMRPASGAPSLKYRAGQAVAHAVLRIGTPLIVQDSHIVGQERAAGLDAAIVTSNHFSPIDNTLVRSMVWATGRKRMPVVAQEDNLAMDGAFGFMMTYADTLPLPTNPAAVKHSFEPLLKRELDEGNFVLIYPEQEMWFNYRKPRPSKRGAFLYAARFGVPVLPCFVELRDKDKLERPDFVDVSYVLHVLEPIVPDPSLSDRENSIAMAEQDYRQKVAAYERIYDRKLDYRFDVDDIAGWVPTETQRQSVVDARALQDADDIMRLCVA